MKIEEELQRSQELAPHFANYREEAPLLSTSEVEQLLASRAMLPTPSRNIIRNSIMTLAGLTGIGAIAYFAFFSTPHANNVTDGTHLSPETNPSYRSNPTDSSHQTFASTQTPREGNQKLTKPAERGPWSAGNDQFYADLTPEELARLGIVVSGDSVFAYKQLHANTDSVAGMALTIHSIGGAPILASPPQGVAARKFYPILMTNNNGNGAAYQLENGWGMIADNQVIQQFREWLQKPGTHGLYALGYTAVTSNTDKGGQRHDAVTLTIGKDFPQPRFFPLGPPGVDGYSDTIMKALVELTHFYDGSSASKPAIAWPKSLTIKVDTITAKDMLDQLDSGENSSTLQNLHSIMARLNELVPVIVRKSAGTGAPGKNDFIFWYEPSEELFNALPPAQASVFRAKLAAPPHCFTAPNGVMTTAEITYCVAEPQVVQVVVYDLTGKPYMILSQLAVAGDNILQFSTETLHSGMYIVTVNGDGTDRSHRIWVENANPKHHSDLDWTHKLPHAPDQTLMVNGYDPTMPHPEVLAHTGLLSIQTLELNAVALAKIGVESTDSLAAYYSKEMGSNAVNYMGLLRTGTTAYFKTLDKSEITAVSVPLFMPTFITDGSGTNHLMPSCDSAEEAKAFAAIDQLVPILLRENSLSDSIQSRDLIFWYQPTPEFLASLSDSARAVAKSMIGQSGSASVHSGQGVIEKVSAYPNPSKGSFTVKMTLGTPRMLTLTMRNLLGQQVAPPVVMQSQGASEQKLNFDSLGEGVYILDVTSDAGEEYLQRLVIVR